VSFAEFVVNVQARHHRRESWARFVHAEELGNGVAQGLDAVVWAEKRDLRDHPKMPEGRQLDGPLTKVER
jgi:hypothetical protein